ncbi:MAG: hypothetical protein HOJ90_11730 [Alphaproteobacteria bacterium]|mgnify:CR=1 FL=1|nr:hypothetical protein [Alphaproteobacteria bacterium]
MRRNAISGTIARKAGALAFAGALLSAVALGTTSAHAQDAYGAKVGEVIPHQLEVPDQTNQVQSFVTLKKNKGLIMLFSRSLAW